LHKGALQCQLQYLLYELIHLPNINKQQANLTGAWHLFLQGLQSVFLTDRKQTS
jgi:hypothetical protein